MNKSVLETENTYESAIENGDAELRVKLGWKRKEGSLKERFQGRLETAALGGSRKNYDLNLAAILTYSDATKPELVAHRGAGGRGKDAAGSVQLSRDDRVGKDGEELRIRLNKVPPNVERIVLFMNVGGANAMGQSLADVQGVYAQVQDAGTRKVYLREEEAFRADCAREYCCYTFAALCRSKDGWRVKGLSRWSDEDREQNTLAAMTQ